jgi:urocanate hydratase
MSCRAEKFKRLVNESFKKHVELVNLHVSRGMNFFDYAMLPVESQKRRRDIAGRRFFPISVVFRKHHGAIASITVSVPFRWV